MVTTSLSAIAAVLLSCSTMHTLPPTNYTSALINGKDQQLLFLVNEHMVNSRGDTLAHYEGSLLKNHIDQTIGSVNGAEIRNLSDDVIGTVQAGELLNVNGNPIMRTEGGTVEEQAKVAAGYFFFLQ